MGFENPVATRALMELLDGLSHAELRAFGIEALRRWRKRERPQQPRDPIEHLPDTVFSLHGDWGVEMVKLLAEHKGVAQVDANALKEPFIDDEAMVREWMSGVAEFIWWLVRAGLAVEYVFGNKGIDQSRFKCERPVDRTPAAGRRRGLVTRRSADACTTHILEVLERSRRPGNRRSLAAKRRVGVTVQGGRC